MWSLSWLAMPRPRRLRTAAAALLVAAAACGGADAATSTAPATPVPNEAATATGAATTDAATPPSTIPPTTVDPIAAEFGKVSITGDPLPEAQRSVDDLAVGMAAPVVTGSSHDGTMVSIGGGVGPQALLFAAHWCSHCTAEVPRVADWLAATGGVEGVHIVLVTVGVDPNQPNWPPSEWLATAGWKHPVMRDDEANSAFRAYGGAQIPYWVILDADGEVVERIVGETEIPQLEAVLRAVG
jgi:thiol-disulfide isomerase/thioredoxin